jgi:hypothetical protein
LTGKHQEDRADATRTWKIDWFSTALMFPGWAEYGNQPLLWRGPPTYDPLVAYQPAEMIDLALAAGFTRAEHVSAAALTERYVAGRASNRP